MISKIWFIQFKGLLTKEFKQLLRDLILIIFMVYAFTGDIYFAGSGVTLQLKNAALKFIDRDQSFASRELKSKFREPFFKNLGDLDAKSVKDENFNHKEAMIYIEIPNDYQKNLYKNKSQDIQALIDSTHSIPGHLASMYANRIVLDYGITNSENFKNMPDSIKEFIPPIEDDYRTLFNPNQNDSWFMCVSQLLNVITVFAILLPGSALVREKEKGTIEQLLVSPVTPIQILLPKIIATTFFILIGICISWICIINPIFHVPTNGNFIWFLFYSVFYILAVTGIGLLAGTFCKNMSQVGMITILIVAPMIFLSGAWTPPEAMNSAMKLFMFISPLHYFIDITYNLMFKAANFTIIFGSFLKMLLIGVICIGSTVGRFRSQFN